MVAYLKGAGSSVVEVSGGQDALDVMTGDNAIDVAIVDVRMEPVGGFEFILEMRSRDIGTPVILVTGDQNSDLLERANKLGVAAVLMKPVEKDRLVKTVERALQQARRGR